MVIRLAYKQTCTMSKSLNSQLKYETRSLYLSINSNLFKNFSPKIHVKRFNEAGALQRLNV